jgi:hypothetical protein
MLHLGNFQDRGMLAKQDEWALANFKSVAHSPECDAEPCDAFERNCSIVTANRINSSTFQYIMANW